MNAQRGPGVVVCPVCGREVVPGALPAVDPQTGAQAVLEVYPRHFATLGAPKGRRPMCLMSRQPVDRLGDAL